jgi:hypothetical protein
MNMCSTSCGSTVGMPMVPDLTPPVSLDCPVVLVPGNMGDASKTAAALRSCGVGAVDAKLGPVSSSHDRACELFFALVGGRVDYGKQHSAKHGHARFGRVCVAQHPRWSADRPVVLLCHSQGGTTALALLELLAANQFEQSSGHVTSAAWVRGVCAIACPLAGVSWIHSLPLVGVPPPSSPSRVRQRECAVRCLSCESELSDRAEGAECDIDEPHDALPIGTGVVALFQLVGYLLHVCLASFSWFTHNVWDWRLDHWRMTVRDLPALLTWTHALLHTTDMALYDLTPAAAHQAGCRMRTHDGVYYVALACRVTLPRADGGTRFPSLSHRTSVWHAALALLGAATARRPCCRHSDGLVPTCSQRCPPCQPRCHLPDLTAPVDESGVAALLADAAACAARRAALREALRPGVWCSGEPWCLDHGASRLDVGGAALAFALQVILPAMCESAHLRR